MDTLTQKQDVEKLLSMTDNVVVRNDIYRRARNSGAEPREYGRLNASIDELAKTAEKCRKQAGGMSMDDPIISRDLIRAKARSAFDRKVKRNQHGMPPDAPALADWLDEWDRCAAAQHARAVVKFATAGGPP